jgi:metallo-beta-lactamase family protein
MELSLTFHGAAGTVTGSRHLLAAGHRRILVDAGLFQGLKALRVLNWEPLPFDARHLDAVLLTHAHIDHCGYLPRLAKLGLRAPIHCTRGTQEMAELLLRDAAQIQEEDAEYANRKGFSKHRPALPLFTVRDAEAALRSFRAVEFAEWIELENGLRARFLEAGHILGAAQVEVRAGETTLVFSGDVGRYDAPLHCDPSQRPPCDVLVVESTYGDRLHEPTRFADQLVAPLRAAFERGGVVLVPAFAVGRAQVVVLTLHELMVSGALPEVPIHLDSPMAVDATAIYRRHLRDGALCSERSDALYPANLRLHRSVEESKALNDLRGPRVIVSSSGMLTGGRVLHHLARLLPDPRNLVVLAGYQAAGTRGRALLEGAPSLRVHGRDVVARAQALALHGVSAHADADELVRWVAGAGGPDRKPRVAFVTHGEPAAAEALARRLESELGISAEVPRHGERFALPVST